MNEGCGVGKWGRRGGQQVAVLAEMVNTAHAQRVSAASLPSDGAAHGCSLTFHPRCATVSLP